MPKSEVKEPKNIMLKTIDVAKLFGVTDRRIQQLAKQGIIKSVKVGRYKKYDLYPTTLNYINHLKDKIKGKDSKKTVALKSRKIDAEASFKESKAAIAALELKELEGNMHSSEDVEQMTTDLVFTIRSMILALPGRLAIDIANVKTASEASEIIKKECYYILNELANYKYDPNMYKQRVRERKGWNAEENV